MQLMLQVDALGVHLLQACKLLLAEYLENVDELVRLVFVEIWNQTIRVNWTFCLVESLI